MSRPRPVFVHSRFPAPAGTDHLVEYVWVLRAPHGPLSGPERTLVVPNARPALVVALGDPATCLDPLTGERGPATGVVGVRRTPVVLEHTGEAHHVGLRLRPYALHGLAGLSGLVDRVAPIDGLLDTDALDRELRDVAAGDGADEAQGGVLARAFVERVGSGHVAPDRRRMIDDALAAAEGADGLITLLDVARSAGVNPSLLRTVLDEFTGLGGPQLLAVVRLHSFLGSGTGPWQGEHAVRALERYPVHAHAAREVLRFTGMEPEVFVRVRDGVLGLLDGR